MSSTIGAGQDAHDETVSEPEQIADTLVIRRIQPGDVSGLVAFYNNRSEDSKRTFRPLGTAITSRACRDFVRGNRPETDTKLDLVALDGGRIVGWAFLWNLRSAEPVLGIAVADDFRGRGLGRELMGQLMREARQRKMRKVLLSVVKDNEVARKMYEKHGFVAYEEFTGKDGLRYFRMVAEL